jgi:putative phage-type endonuclease
MTFSFDTRTNTHMHRQLSRLLSRSLFTTTRARLAYHRIQHFHHSPGMLTRFESVPYIYSDDQLDTRAVPSLVRSLRDFDHEVKSAVIDRRVTALFERQCKLQAAVAGTEAWKKERSGRLSGSEIAAALGKTPYCSAAKFFKQKTGQIKRDVANQFMVAHGNKYEFEAACVYSAVTGKGIIRDNPGSVTHHQYPWLAATPDFITVDGIVVEIKCPKTRAITHGIPGYYYPQVQLQMNVCQLDVSHFVQYRPPSLFMAGEMDILEIWRDPLWFELSIEFLSEFHQAIEQWKAAPSNAVELKDSLQRKVIANANRARSVVPNWQIQPYNQCVGDTKHLTWPKDTDSEYLDLPGDKDGRCLQGDPSQRIQINHLIMATRDC